MRAELKSSLSRVYASGATPRFLTVLPGGWDEAWAVGEMMMIVPVVPPNAPADLQFALRLRRDAMIEGRCPSCDAFPDVDHATPGDEETPPLGAIGFRHKRRCPARDENVSNLREVYRDSLHSMTEEERLEAANGVVRHRMAELKESVGVQMAAPEAESAAMRILDSLSPPQNPRQPCGHLIADPYQTWNVLIAEGGWRCDQCWAYLSEAVKSGVRLDPVEDFTCDLCRRYTPKTIGPMVLRVDTFVMRGGVCSSCSERYQMGEPPDVTENTFQAD